MITTHEQYNETLDDCVLVRDCIEGEPTVKRKTTTYLENPNQLIAPNTIDSRYRKYIQGAEFDGTPSNTLASMIGVMNGGEANIELPTKVDYLIDNADGDGMPLSGLVETIESNLLQVKFHVLVAEYQGLGDVDIDKVSIADVKRLNPRASIKQYTRESLVDWDFTRINGVLQLSMLLLKESGTKRELGSLTKTKVDSYLMLALDAEGNYFQRRYVKGDTGDFGVTKDDHYPQVNKAPIKWLPVEIVADEETPSYVGIPKAIGFMYPICSLSLQSYRTSADYKESLRVMQPTVFGSGWKEGDEKQFELQNGRKQVAFGAGAYNAMPDGVTNEVISLSSDDQAFIRYFELNKSKARAVGAKIDDDANGQETATKAGIDNRNAMAAMLKVVKNTEAGLRRIISYCAMYEGLWSPEDVEANLDKIIIDLPVEFAKSRMTAEEANSVAAIYSSGLVGKDEAVRILVAGGFTVSDADKILGELEAEGPPPIVKINQNTIDKPNSIDNEEEK